MTIGAIAAAFGILLLLVIGAFFGLGRQVTKRQVAEESEKQVEVTAHDVFEVEKTVSTATDDDLRDKLRKHSH